MSVNLFGAFLYLEPLDDSGGVCQSDAATERTPGGIFGIHNL